MRKECVKIKSRFEQPCFSKWTRNKWIHMLEFTFEKLNHIFIRMCTSTLFNFECFFFFFHFPQPATTLYILKNQTLSQRISAFFFFKPRFFLPPLFGHFFLHMFTFVTQWPSRIRSCCKSHLHKKNANLRFVSFFS